MESPQWMAAQQRRYEEEGKDQADKESAKLRQSWQFQQLGGSEEIDSKRAADRRHSRAEEAPAMVAAPVEESGSELLGTWAYGDGTLPTKYTISRTVEGWLRVDERLPNDVRVFGILQPQGKWLQTKLCSSDGTKFGTMRLRYAEDDDTILSNVKAAGGATWGADIIGRREEKAAKQPVKKEVEDTADPEVPSAADLLSKFFDTIKTRENAQRPAAGGLRRGFLSGPPKAPAREREPVAIAVANTAVAAALGLGDPLEPFGYAVRRLRPSGGRMACAEATAAGAPLLALPLAACWTAAAARAEAGPAAAALEAAAARNPNSSLLQADHTWIALHILNEKRLGESAQARRKAHLGLLPPAPEVLLSWSSRDLEALHGSRWQEATKQRMVEVMADYHKLVAELGPTAVSELGLDVESYTWARQVVQQLGLHFVAPDGSTMLLLAPGLELLAPDADVPPSTEGARLEFTAGSSPTLVIYATRQYRPGEAVALSHSGIACSSGYRLLGCGQLLEANPFESVEITLKIPVVPESLSATANLWEVLEGLDAALRGDHEARPGECLPPELAEGRPRVEVAESRKQPEVLIHLRLSRGRLLPDKLALWYLGLALTAHSDRMGKIMEQERDVVNPLGPDACARRALSWLGKRIQWAIEDGPSRPSEDAERIMSRHSGEGIPRRVLALRLVAAERQLLGEAAEAVKQRLAEPAAPRAVLMVPAPLGGRDALTAELLALPAGEEPQEAGRLGRAVAQLRGCAEALGQLAARFGSLISDRNFAEAAGMALKEELKVLDGLLAASLLEPMVVTSVSPRITQDVPVKACKDAHAAALAAAVARFEWDAARAEKENQKDKLQQALVGSAKVRMKLMDFAAAQRDFQRCPGLHSSLSADVVAMARTCALDIVARSDKVLSGSWKGCGATLTALREKMRDVGYMRAGARWPWPTRVPPVDNLAEIYRTMWDEGSGFAKEARKAGTKVPSTTWWVMKEAKSDLRIFISLFILRQPLPLNAAVSLLGADACKLLLERCALTCYSQAECKGLEPADAVKLVSGKGPEVEILANVSLWPVDDEVLVAIDFDQGTYIDGQFEPVMYLAEDSKALLAASSRQPSAKRVLDVCCGSGAGGIAALKRSAESAVFMDTNPRSLRFAEFGAVLNGVEDKATFVNKSLCDDALPDGTFQAILAGLPSLPNPDQVMNRGGPVYKEGGMDGQRFLEAVIAKAPLLLSPNGTVTATCMVRDVDGLASRVESWLDAAKPRGFRGTIFRGEALPLDRFVGAATVGCNHAQRSGYFRGLHKEAGVQTMSEALLLLWAPPAGPSGLPSKAEVRSERQGLWSDQDYLWLELERLLLAAGAGAAEEPLYELDWADGRAGEEPEMLAPAPAPSGARGSGLRRARVSKDLQEEFERTKSMEGATWNDIAQMQVGGQGFTPPVLCDLVWRKSTGALKSAGSAFPHIYSQKIRGASPSVMALLELVNCQCPDQVLEGLRIAGSQDRITYGDGMMNIFRKGLTKSSSGIPSNKVFLNAYDILVIPLTGFQGYGSGAMELPTEVLALFQSILKQVQKRARPIRVLLLSCGSIGPGYVDWHGEDVPAAAPLLGLVRSLRCEVPQLPVIWLDTDALAAGYTTSNTKWLEQAMFELDLATPKNGLWSVSTPDRARWFMSNNRDVAYRDGQRYLQQLDVSPAMPIFLGREVPAMPRAMAQGGVLVTGGVGGIGLVAAEALAEVGARCLVLSSRSGDFPKGLGIEERLEALRSRGVLVSLEKCDTGKEKDVEALLERIRDQHGALTAVIHTSGLMAEKAFTEMESGGMKRVFDPKAHGASYLHRLTLGDDIGAFMMFSSTAALRGSQGQANYAAANAYLDELARLRVSQGLPAVSVQWPRVELSGEEAEGGLALSVSLGTVKQVVKQLVCGHDSVGPVQAVLPTGYLVASTPPLVSQLEPLLSKAGPILRGQLQEASKPGKKGS